MKVGLYEQLKFLFSHGKMSSVLFYELLKRGSTDSILTLYPQDGAAFAPYRKFTYSGLFWRDRPRLWYFLASVVYSEKTKITNKVK